MPQRFLRPGLRNSVRWNSVSREAQIAFIGLLTLVDDYGQYDARPAVLCAEIFAVWNDQNPKNRVLSAGFRSALQELAGKRMIDIFDGPEGKTYLQVTQWQERVREGAKRKWGGDNFSLRIPADSCGFLPPSPSSTPSPSPTPSPSGADAPAILTDGRFSAAWEAWQRHLKEKRTKTTPSAFQKQLEKCQQLGVETAVIWISYAIEHNWQGLYEPKSPNSSVPRPNSYVRPQTEADRRKPPDSGVDYAEIARERQQQRDLEHAARAARRAATAAQDPLAAPMAANGSCQPEDTEGR